MIVVRDQELEIEYSYNYSLRFGPVEATHRRVRGTPNLPEDHGPWRRQV